MYVSVVLFVTFIPAINIVVYYLFVRKHLTSIQSRNGALRIISLGVSLYNVFFPSNN